MKAALGVRFLAAGALAEVVMGSDPYEKKKRGYQEFRPLTTRVSRLTTVVHPSG
jgi:hypothetical protein